MKTKYIILSAIAACSVLFSCQEPTPEIEPIFPEAVTKTVKAGEEVVISFNANMDWTLSVPENTLNTFWLDDNGFSTYKVTGKAADGINVTVNVSEVESFEDQSCDVTLTMGSSSKVIAKIIRSSKDPVLSVYVAEVEDGEVKYTEDGQDYLYGSSEAADIDLFWTGSDFRLPIMVVSNFSWTYEAPEWISIDVPENGADTVKVNVFGVPSKYPLEPTSGKIRFKFADKVVKEYNISIPGCEDIYSYSVGMSLTELTFNYSGKFKTVTGFIDGPATATISGTKDVDVFAVEVVDGKYVLGNQAGPSWLNVDVDPFDSSEGADVLQTRNVSISVAQNEGEERSAAIFFMPPTGWSSKESIFNEDMESVKEEYVKYMLPVTQLSMNQDFILMLSAPSEMALNGAEFSVTKDQTLYSKFGATKFAYDLVYTNRYASDYARMSFATPVTSYKVYDLSGKDMTESEDFFLSVSLDDDLSGGVILMDTDQTASGYVVFKGSSDNVLAVVKCSLNPDNVIGEVADVYFLGESEQYAPMAGATLEFITEGTLYDRYKEYGVPIYHLTYTMENMPMLLYIPQNIKSYMPNPYALIDNFRINNQTFDDGSFERIDGGVQVYMEMPEGKSKITGNIMFYTSKSPSNEYMALVLAVTMDLTGSETE